MNAKDLNIETCTIEVCTDCRSFVETGEVFDGEGNDITTAHLVKMMAVWGDEGLDFCITMGSSDYADCLEAFGSECEPWFSQQDCDGCKSKLGGDRWHATVWL